MKIIFLKDAPGQGRKGEIKEASDGFARNFLLPKGFAAQVTDALLAKVQNELRQKHEKEDRDQQKHRQLKMELDKRIFTIEVKVGAKNQIYGSVHEGDIIKKIKEKTNIEFEKKQLVIPKHIKELGEYQIEIKLGNNLSANPRIKLINSEQKNGQE